MKRWEMQCVENTQDFVMSKGVANVVTNGAYSFHVEFSCITELRHQCVTDISSVYKVKVNVVIFALNQTI
jgi:hypothetical protein